MLPSLTGKVFYSSKKCDNDLLQVLSAFHRMPIPVDMRTKTKLLNSIEAARNSTVFYSGAGACR